MCIVYFQYISINTLHNMHSIIQVGLILSRRLRSLRFCRHQYYTYDYNNLEWAGDIKQRG